MIKPPTFGHAVLVMGPEALLADRAVTERIKAARALEPSAELTQVEAATIEGDDLAEMTGASLFASHSIAVIRDLGSLAPDLHEQILALAASCPDDLCLILVHGGGVKAKGLVDKLKKAGIELVDAQPLKQWNLPEFVMAEAKRSGGRMDQPTAQAVVEAVGHDLRALAGAVGQLLHDSPDGLVDVALVRRYFGGRAEVTSFAVADDVLNGDTAHAIEKLRWALSTGVAPVLVVSALAGGLRNLGKYLDVRGSGMRDQEVAREVGCPPWKVKDLARQSRGWSTTAVAQGLQAVARADADVKGAATDADYALERVVVALRRIKDVG